MQFTHVCVCVITEYSIFLFYSSQQSYFQYLKPAKKFIHMFLFAFIPSCNAKKFLLFDLTTHLQ